MKSKELKFDDINIGDTASFNRIIDDADVKNFADISGDYNPLHMEDSYAVGTQFKGRIVHGMLVGALVSRLIGMELPGKNALIVKESLEFKKPVRIGDSLTIKGKVIHKSVANKLIEVSVEVWSKELVVSGLVHVHLLQ